MEREISAGDIKGLSTEEAEALRQKYGLNKFTETKRQSAFVTFLAEFKSPLILMLIVAAILSFISGSYASGVLIILIVIVSAIIDFSVSYRSEKAVEALVSHIEPKATVMRDGAEKIIDLGEIVPGDVVILSAGNIIPADGEVIAENDFYVNESSLTGESVPVEKVKSSEVYMGSGTVSGRAYVRITAIGNQTKFAKIVSLLSTVERSSEFERGVKEFSILIAKVAIFMAVFVFAVNALLKHELLESFIFALALAVGITPELLPAIIAINVSRSSMKMAKKGVIIKRLSAIENFGGMNILCTDKTGTLTEDRITVVKYVDIAGNVSPETMKFAYVTSRFLTGTRAPLDDAILRFKDFDIDSYTKVDEVPFDFERRRESFAVDYATDKLDPNTGKKLIQRIILSKGAPENVLDASQVSDDERALAMRTFDNLSADGYRVLGVSYKEVSLEKNDFSSKDETGMVFKGFIGFIDPPKAGVKEVLDNLEKQNIEMKVITGDHRMVAEKIAAEVGIVSKGVLESSEIDSLTDEQLAVRAENATLFTRVTPVQKNRIILALQSRGHTVGYMGDGINDAPALRTADVGISVDNAVDVAKEAADIILLTKSLEQLSLGVNEGRKTFVNTVKYISMAISSNFGNMFSMTGASLFLPFLPMLPVQILLNNLLYECSQFSLAADNVDKDVLRRPNPWNIGQLKKFMVVFGAVSSVFDFLTFYVLYSVLGLSSSAFQTGWFLESFASQALVVFLIRSHKSIFKMARPHISVVLSAVIAVCIAWGIALTSVGSIFGFVSLPAVTVFYVVLIVIADLVVIETVKFFFYRKLVVLTK